jgi:hypothetical protein
MSRNSEPEKEDELTSKSRDIKRRGASKSGLRPNG